MWNFYKDHSEERKKRFLKKFNKYNLPSTTGPILNCRRCGSSRAPKNPIDALVAIILIEHTKMLGIFNNVINEAET